MKSNEAGAASNQVSEKKEGRQSKVPYVRPGLLHYGALDEVTKMYNYSPCASPCNRG